MSSTIPRIIQLSQNVVDKIAAGEVVIRPVNAVKELVENSLDAGATEVNVSIRAGGLELIKIQVSTWVLKVGESTFSDNKNPFLSIFFTYPRDFAFPKKFFEALPCPLIYLNNISFLDNGHGINREELSIACCRFTTSKLREFEDLQKIQTFGFRGEALASISLVSNLIITTRTANEICASKACFKEGKLIGQIERSAGLLGTTICVEKLFQNMPSRLAAFRQPSEEANKIADILIRYSIHYPKISFSYRRLDGNGYDFRTSGDGDQHGTIKRLLHEKASNGLTNLEFNNSSLHFSAKICLATPVAIFTSKAVQTRNDKIKIFHLFVNGRSVESFRLQKSFDSIFTSRDLLCPFASFSLLIDPQRVDVNIHPTKKLVYFLCEDDIIEFIGKQIEKFVNEIQSRQSLQINNLNEELEGDCSKKNKNNRKRKAGNEKEIISGENLKNLNNLNCSSLPSSSSSFLNVSSKVQSNSPKVAPKNKIRVDFLNRSLDEFVLTNEDLNLRPNSSVRLSLLKKVAFEEENNEEGGSNINPIEINEIERENGENIGGKTNNKNDSQVDCCIPREFSFNSLVDLRREICQKADNKLVELFKKHLLIGFFDSENALIQSENNVYLINNQKILRQFFYQLIIFSFGNMGAYDLIIQSENSSTKNLSIYKLLLLEEEEKEKKIANLCQILVKNREILWDFFSIKIILNSINEDAVLAAIPCLINGYLPEMEGLPLLLYKLANVNYEDEKSCYSQIAFALADFHLPSISEEDYENLNDEQQNIFKKQNLRVQRTLRSLIFPALRNRFLPSSELEEYIKELTSTAKAFKHFGRC